MTRDVNGSTMTYYSDHSALISMSIALARREWDITAACTCNSFGWWWGHNILGRRVWLGHDKGSWH